MATDGARIEDQAAAALVECVPAAPEPVAQPTPPEAPTPVVAAREATVEHTGADPPPEG